MKSVSKKIVKENHKSNLLLQEAVFLERFGQLISAEVPLLRALEIAATTLTDRKLQKDFLEMKSKLERGQSVTDTFKEYPEYFTVFHLAIVESGEREGHFEEGFSQVADSLRREAESLQLEEISGVDTVSTLHLNPGISNRQLMGPMSDQLSMIGAQLSSISAHLAEVSRHLSQLSKQTRKVKKSTPKKVKRKR